MASQKSRLTFIDGTRGIAALCVLASHLLEEFVPESKSWSRNSFNLGEVGVVAFFLVSGFVIPLSLERSRSVAGFAVGRIFRIYPLYLAALVASFALAWVGIKPFAEHVGSNQPRFWLTHLLMVQEYAGESGLNIVEGSWTLLLEMVWYVGIALLFLLGLNRRTRLLAFLAAAGVAALAAASLVLDRRLPMGRICLLQSCLVGMIFFRAYQQEMKIREALLWLAINMVATSLAIWTAFGHFQHKEFAFSCVAPSWLAGYGLFFGLFFVRESRLAKSWLLDYIGEISYSVYLLHPLVLYSLSAWLGASWQAFLLTLAISLPAAHFSYHWIEKPAIQVGKQILSWMHPAPAAT